ncbi:MAG TPA: hypothetical protein PKA64_03150 [Myxococcota bacterium]|nr:hypothetical protein [Myxococcota bacterium]
MPRNAPSSHFVTLLARLLLVLAAWAVSGASVAALGAEGLGYAVQVIAHVPSEAELVASAELSERDHDAYVEGAEDAEGAEGADGPEGALLPRVVVRVAFLPVCGGACASEGDDLAPNAERAAPRSGEHRPRAARGPPVA